MSLIPAGERDTYAVEYQRLGAELIGNESMGDARASLYLGLWGGGVAGVAALVSQPPRDDATTVAPLVALGLVVLLLLGCVTLARIGRRNHRTDQLSDALVNLRSLLFVESPALLDRAAGWGDLEPDQTLKVKERRPTIGHAGLIQVIGVANAVVPCLIALVLGVNRPEILGAAMVAGLLAQLAVVHVWNGRQFDERVNRRAEFNKARRTGASLFPSLVAWQQIEVGAGGIVLRTAAAGATEIAVVHRRRHGGDFTLPKGHPDRGETLQQAAVREVLEETGCLVAQPGEDEEPLPIAYLAGGRPKIVVFYRMQLQQQTQTQDRGEVRETLWLSIDEARARLSYTEEGRLVDYALRNGR
jgi:8-oxo-dGTP diphosphatase